MRLCGHTTDVRVDLRTFSVFCIPQSWDFPVEHFRDNIKIQRDKINAGQLSLHVGPLNNSNNFFVAVTVLQGHMIIVFGAANVITSEFLFLITTHTNHAPPHPHTHKNT